MNYNQARALVTNYLRADIPTALWGNPGIGKSALASDVADSFNLEFIDIRLGQVDPIDLNGYIHKNAEGTSFDYLPWARFPLVDTPLPPGKKGWLIMFDEINTAPRQNLAAAYKIFWDRMVGSRRLHGNCRLMLGGNLVGQGLAGALPPPLVSRVSHIVMNAELTPELRTILGPTIFSFLQNHPKFMYMEESKPNTPFPTFRTWKMAKDYLDKNTTLLLEGLQGIVGTAAAVAYISFQQQERELLDHLNGVEAFPLEKSQDLLDYLATDVLQLEKHLHRFPGEWHTIAKVRAETIRAEMSGTAVA